MTYTDGLSYLFGLQRHGIKLGLENITRLLARLNHPQQQFPVLHIGGTNGKGSSAAMVASVLQSVGFRVGLYTSPHLVDFRERIRVQGNCIGEESVIDFVCQMVTDPSERSRYTFFEIATALAFSYFADERVDIAVVEVGMGGRFDATNVCQSIGILVTNVALDHEEYLGRTLSAIAFEKAGILKSDVPVILGPMPDPSLQVLMGQASRVGAPVYRYGKDFVARGLPGSGLDYDGIFHQFRSLPCPLEGPHQVVNVANALALLEVSGISGLCLTDESLHLGLQRVSWEGRLECIRHEPLVYLDGAHNPASAQVVAEYLSQVKAACSGRKLIMILGMMRDKNIHAFITILSPIVDTLILTRIDHSRAATLDELKIAVTNGTNFIRECPDPRQAWDLAHQLAQSQDLICVTGSLLLVGHIKSILSGCHYAPIVG